jgi:uncharacterized protein
MQNSTQSPRTFLQLDPWMPEYEGSVEIDPTETNVAGIDCSVEDSEWRAVEQCRPDAVPTFYFIDGVRRTDARVMAWSLSGLIHGLLGTVAAGAVRSKGPDAVFDRCDVGRFLVLSGGNRRSEAISVGEFKLEFEGFASLATAPADLAGELQELMRQLEAKVAESVIGDDRLVFIDGPLAYISSLGAVVGVIKRISQPYLDTTRFALVTSLAIGQRTPLFLISDGKRDRYSWYLRIGERRHFDHVLTGIVRLEVRAVAGLETAKQLATLSAGSLVRFASTAMRDPRAPQNLVPIGALETELRRRMGDSLIVRRAIEKRISEGVEL